jgi:hypothetical protein
MSFLFKVEKKMVQPNVETLMISPFKEIWERDTTKDKRYALEDMAYIEFNVSVKKSNPYSGYHSQVKKDKIKKDIITRKGWTEDELIKEGMRKLELMQRECSFSYNYYMSARNAAEKLQFFFNTFDMEAVNLKTGLPIYKPKEITSAITDTTRVLQNLNELEEKVDNEIYEVTKNKGQKSVSIFANPESLT